jgi:membrane protease YdiL (CAAX protease family)
VADAGTGFDEYVTWYGWAASNLGDSPIASHTAAAAAMRALAEGADRDAAAAAASSAARDQAALAETTAGYGSRHRQIEWFVWARANLDEPDERRHEAARAAVQAIETGGTRDSALAAAWRVAARRASPPLGTVTGRRLLLAVVLWPVLAAAIVVATVLVLAILADPWLSRHDADLVAIITAEAYIGLLAALMLAFGGPAGLRDRLGFRFTSVGHLALGIPVWVGALIVGGLITLALTPLIGPPADNTTPLLKTSFDPLFVSIIVPTVCLMAPVCEEMLFRGALYGWLRRRVPFTLAIPITAAIFAGAHLLPTLFPLLFVVGVATAMVREWTGSTLNSFVVHATQNSFAVAATYYALTHQ